MPDLSQDTWANIVIGLIAVGGSVGGAILGAREGAQASLKATQALAIESEKRQRASVRLLLRLEIDLNLANLRALQSELIQKATRKTTDDDGNVVEEKLYSDSYARCFAHAAMPAWTRQAWGSMTSLLSPALSANEIEQANRFYGQLETILGIREQLMEMLNERQRVVDFGPPVGQKIFDPMTFGQYAPKLAEEVNTIITSLLDRSNPIAEQEEGASAG